jgi:Tfp pilus assembly protein PilF
LTAPASAQDASAPPAAISTAFFPSRERLRRWAPVVVALVAALVYANAIENGYVLDDRGVLLKNPLVHSLSGIWLAFAHPYWPEAIGGGQYRPLAIASFSLDWYLFGGDPRWLHAINVLWHAAAAVMVWFLAAELLAPGAALGAALLFAVHPVHVEAVANVVGRSECMAATFVIAALLAHRRARWMAPVFFALALASKESAAVFLGVAVLHDLLLAGPPREALRRRRALYAAYGVVALAYGATLYALFRDANILAPATIFTGASTVDRLLTVATVIPEYLRLLLVPAELSADYLPAVINLQTTVTWEVVWGVLLAAALGAAIFRSWRRAPELAFALTWVPVTLAPVSNVLFVTGVVLAERTLYLPSAGAALAVGWALERYGARVPRASIAFLMVVLVAFAARSWTRTEVWHDSRTLQLTLLRDHPESYRAHWAMARAFEKMGKHAEAAQEYTTARTLFARDAELWRESAEQRLEVQDWDGATRLLLGSLAIRPNNAGDRMRMADVRFRAGDFKGAIAAARSALAVAPDSVRAAIIVAVAGRALGDTALVDSTYARMTALHPDSWEMHVGYADVLLVKGDTTAAREHADRAVELSAGAPPALAVRARAKGEKP